MSRDDAVELRAQLQSAIESGEAEPLELAALAGLLERRTPDEPLLTEVRDLEVSDGQLFDALDAAADDVLEADEDDDPDERFQALVALDELCAAATFLDRAGPITPLVEQVVGFVRAFPEIWRPHAREATSILQDAPPRPLDPARALWAAVEASRFDVPRSHQGAEARTLEALGLPFVLSIASVVGPQRLAASTDLPPEPPWRTLDRGPGWELALTTDDDHRAVLLLAGTSGTFERDGAPIVSRDAPEGTICPANPGRWRVRLAERDLRFELLP